MLGLFRTEVELHLGTLTEQLLALERGEPAAERLESLMRSSHSIKGAARMVGLDHLVTLAHTMEDYFVGVQRGEATVGGAHIDIMLKALDVLDGSSACLAENGGDDCIPADIAELNETLRKILQEPGAQAGSADVESGKKPAPKAKRKKRKSKTAKAGNGKAPADAGDTDAKSEGKSDIQSSRVVRLAAEHIDRMLGLSGETVVETRWIARHSDNLLLFKRRQNELIAYVDALRTQIDGLPQGECLAAVVNDLQFKAEQTRAILGEQISEVDEFDRRMSSLARQLNREIIASRMRPFADGTHGFQRLVRDIARSLGKKARLVISGEQTQIDRDILERIEAPLNHLLRNAIDHGLETPAQRAAAGKPEAGTISLRASHNAGMLQLVIGDDGAGVDLDRLRAKVVSQGHVNESMAEGLSQTELLDFLFLPGFSTRDEVSEISGRGVGLDIVHSVVQEMHGKIRASTEPGQGLTVQLLLPLTLSVMRCLLCTIAGQPYAFPLARIEGLVELDRKRIQVMESREYFEHNGRRVGLVPVSQVLGFGTETQSRETLPVVIIGDRNRIYGLVVEELLGERELAVHTLSPRLGKIKDIAAGAILEDGSPTLIVDADDLLRSVEVLISGERIVELKTREQPAETRSRKRILVVDDSITVREVERKLLESQGYRVDVAVDGMDGWNTVRQAGYDLVVSDIDMPRMNGIEFVTLIKNAPELNSIPVMIVSYKDRDEDRERGLHAGADYYLTKGSFHDQSLIDAVRDLIGEA